MGTIMQVLGIDYDLCTGCKRCTRSCSDSQHFKWNEEQQKVIFKIEDIRCCFCGQCIA